MAKALDFPCGCEFEEYSEFQTKACGVPHNGIYVGILKSIYAKEKKTKELELQVGNLRAEIEAARKILSGGYHQGMNGLVINRNQVDAWLKGEPTDKPPEQQIAPSDICECGHCRDQHTKSGPKQGECLASDRLGYAICRCEKFVE